MLVEQDKEELVLNNIEKAYNLRSRELLLEEFVHFDDNTVVAGILTDEKIISEVNEDEFLKDGVNNEEDVPTV